MTNELGAELLNFIWLVKSDFSQISELPPSEIEILIRNLEELVAPLLNYYDPVFDIYESLRVKCDFPFITITIFYEATLLNMTVKLSKILHHKEV